MNNNIKFILLIFFVILTYYYATDYVYEIGKEHYDENFIVLPDAGFKNVSDKRSIKELYTFKECINFAFLIAFVWLALKNGNALMDYGIIIIIILFIKNILFSSTILPDPSGKCKKFSFNNLYKGSCHDLIISTHCTLSFVAFLIILKYEIGGHIFAIMSGAYNILLIYLILSLRQHYTIDIINAMLYGFFVTYFVTNTNLSNLLQNH
jgi:hypothetical protein